MIPASEGGFVLLLYDQPLSQAKESALRIQKAVHEQAFFAEQGPVYLTVSIVLSSLPAQENGVTEQMDAALQALKAQSQSNVIISLEEKG